jgi:hypothetical protein
LRRLFAAPLALALAAGFAVFFAPLEADFLAAFDVLAFFVARLPDALELALEAGFVSAFITIPGNRLAALPTAVPIARPAVTRIP